MMRQKRRLAGFTLIELVVATAVIGLVAAFAIPQYVTAVEKNKADLAVSRLQMVAKASQMRHVDHPGLWAANGQPIDNSCNATACDAASTSPCMLVACGYLPKDDWDGDPYRFTPTDPSGTAVVAKAMRCTGSSPCASSGSPYATWEFVAAADGSITAMTDGLVGLGGGSKGTDMGK
jgi:prepilin-type N-terminal cleavage/methylation domain-containing protein